MKNIFWILLLLASCQSRTPISIPNFDSESFKQDRGGCKNERIKAFENLQANKNKFLGTFENQIFATLGRYDYQILDKKNEKIFVYFLEKGPHCTQIQNPSQAQCMIIYLNSVSLVKEVVFQKGNPS